MKIIYRYIFKKFLGPFALTFLFALLILVMQFLWKYVDDLVGKGLEVAIVLELLLYASATFVSSAAPLAVLLSSLMTFGSLGERYELIAIKSAGMSINKLVFSLSIFALFIAAGSFWFTDNVSSKAFYKWRALLRDIRDQKPTLSIEEGVFYNGFDNYSIRVGKKGRNNSDIFDVLICDHSKYKGNTTFTYAKSGKMTSTDDQKYMLFYLYNGFLWDENSNNTTSGKNQLVRSTFSEQYKRFDISSFKFEKNEGNNLYAVPNQALSNSELVKRVDTVMVSVNNNKADIIASFLASCNALNNYINTENPIQNHSYQQNIIYENVTTNEKLDILNRVVKMKNDFRNTLNMNIEYNKHLYFSINAYSVEWYRKYVFAVACVIFFFIGAPLGTIIRKGGIEVPLVITIAFFSTYFMLSIFCEKIAKSGVVPVWFGMWMPTLILIPICAFLTYQASVDSALLSSEEISKIIQKAIIRLKKIFSKKYHENPATNS